jgi:3-phenylpropionate/trans-cinnamate dioxygenase ferredoxin reductase subunit
METAQEPGLIVVGAGHAGSELALAARQNGWRGTITLLGEEDALPYQRPPLSKAWLAGQVDDASLALRPPEVYEAAGIVLRRSARMVAIDRAARRIELADGQRLPWRKLALCTGGRPRPLACAGLQTGAMPANLFYLRTRADAEGIRQALRPDARLVVIGAGYVGLEVAASARKLGAQVTVLEAQPRVLARVAGAAVSAFYQAVHEAAGVAILTGTTAECVDIEGDRVVAVRCGGGRVLPADLVVAGLGMLPNVEAARAAGLADAEGIAVDSCSLTADPEIVAAGDCTVQPSALYGRRIRLESVPNALEQARSAAASVCGLAKPNLSVPWFWSDQYDLKLQLAGLPQGHDTCVLRGDPARRSFCAFYLQQGRLLAVDAVNRPAEFMLARRVLAQRPQVDTERLADEALPLKELLAGAPAAALTGKP